MKKIYVFLLLAISIVCILTASAVYVFASSAGETGAEFLKINPDPKITAMGESSVGMISEMPSSALSNPASLIGVYRPILSLNYISLVEDMHYNFTSFATPFGKGTAGISANYLTYGSFDGRTADFQRVSVPECSDILILFTYVMPIRTTIPVPRERAAFGINIKLARSKLARYTAEAVAMDLGLIYKIPFSDKITVGAVYKNLGSTIKFVEEVNKLPTSLCLGVAFNSESSRNLSAVFDFDIPTTGPQSLSLGFNYSPAYFLDVRAGYKYVQDSFSSGVRTGIGLELGSVTLDYAFSPTQHFTTVHHISLSFAVGNIFKPEDGSDYYLKKHFREAVDYYHKNDYVLAKQKFEEILAVYAEHKPSEKYLEKVEEAIEEWDKKDESKTTRLVKKADEALYKNDYVTAKRYYKLALKIDPENPDVKEGLKDIEENYYDVRLAKSRKKNYKQLKKVWNTALEYYQKGDYLNAEEKFNEVLIIDPEHKKTTAYLVEIDNKLKKAAAVETSKIYDQATEFYKNKKYEIAMKYFEAVALAAPERLDAVDFAARCKKKIEEQKKKGVAARIASKQKKIRKELASVFKKALKQYDKSKYNRAIALFNDAKKIAKNYDFYDQLNRINGYIAMSKSALAERYYKNGFDRYQKNKFEEAVQSYRAALKHDPDHTSASVELKRLTGILSKQNYEKGMTYFTQGDMENAKIHFKKALSYNPRMKEALRAIERIK